MTKSQTINRARELGVCFQATSTDQTHTYKFWTIGVNNPGMVNVARLMIPGCKDQFWDACNEALNTYSAS